MPIQILMPALSPTMTEGTVAKWLKSEGDKVSSGDVIAEIETDKATMEVEAVDEGTLGKILVPAGTPNVKVNDPIAILLGEGESAGAASAAPAPKAAAAPAPQVSAPAPTPVTAAPAPAPAAANGTAAHGDRVFASPLARRMAANAGLDIGALSGSGPGGRIVKADIEAALQGGAKPAPRPAAAPAAAPAPMAAPAPAAARAPVPIDTTGLPDYELVPTSTMRKVIARRLTESQSIPHFFLTVDCNIEPLMKVRAELNARGEGKDGFKLSVNDFVIKASALALRRKPYVNAAWSEDGMLMFKSVDVAVAVALPAGLITPIIRNADQKGLATISNEMKGLIAKARDGKLKPEEFQGGSFSISNLGMYGMRQFTAIINPPQSCILAVGAGEQRPVVKDGALAIQNQMTLTLTCDHRVVDGAQGAEFLAEIKKLVEDPLSMML